MTHIEHVEIEGFKRLESLTLEPTGINVITGRNNTGKTSLLEAIELGLEPHTLETFGEHVDTLVNVEHDQAAIVVESADRTQTVTLNQPDAERTREILVEAGALYISELLGGSYDQNNSDEKILEIMDEPLRAIIADTFTPAIIERAASEIVVMTINNTEYFFVFSGEAVSGLYRDVFEKLYEDINKKGNEKKQPYVEIKENLETIISLSGKSETGIVGLTWEPFLLASEPPRGTGFVTTIDSFDLADPPETENGEADAVKVDDIEEFLKENGIVDDLRSFDLDYLVFEDDQQGKYSVPFEFMGDGFKAIVGLLWELLDADSEHSVVLLEEPGSHMHPGYVRELVYFLVDLGRTEDIQLFVTTHNNDFVSDFFGENLTNEERSFLAEEFTLVQLQEDAADVMAYAEAEEHLTELHLDLRGL